MTVPKMIMSVPFSSRFLDSRLGCSTSFVDALDTMTLPKVADGIYTVGEVQRREKTEQGRCLLPTPAQQLELFFCFLPAGCGWLFFESTGNRSTILVSQRMPSLLPFFILHLSLPLIAREASPLSHSPQDSRSSQLCPSNTSTACPAGATCCKMQVQGYSHSVPSAPPGGANTP
jgi:hypothetical protein